LSGDLLTNNSSGAHIHLGHAGIQGAIKIPLNVTQEGGMRSGDFELINNIYNLDPQLVKDLLERKLYVNIITSEYPSGELRGQILPESQAYFYSRLNGSQLNQSKYLTGKGIIISELANNSLTFSGTFSNTEDDINNTSISLHPGIAGVSNPEIGSLTFEKSNSTGQLIGSENSIELNDSEIDQLFNRSLYLQVNSSQNVSGEMRGQLLPEAALYMISFPSGSMVKYPVNSNTSGIFIAEINKNKVNVSGSLNNSDPIYSADIFSGFSGQEGDLILSSESPQNQGGFLLTDLVINELTNFSNRKIYLQIQTFTKENIRGQFHPFANAVFTTFAEGSNVVPINNSQGIAHIEAEVWNDIITLSGSISDLDLTQNFEANFRYGNTGKNGNIAKSIVFSQTQKPNEFIINPSQNSFTFLPNQLSVLSAEGIYAEIKDGLNQKNSIRGQILSIPNFFPNAVTQNSYNSGDTICVIDSQDSFTSISWEEPMDEQGNNINYIFEMSLNKNLSNPIYKFQTDRQTNLEISSKKLDSILTSSNIQKGEQINVYLRISTTDGSLISQGKIDSLFLKKGISTNISDLYSDFIKAKFFPSPLKDNGTLTLSTEKHLDLTLSIIDFQGKIHKSNKLSVFPGKQKIQIDCSELTSGMYFIRFDDNGNRVGALPFIKMD
jgi:hypothetical protein